jgi:hypothetical protein
MFSWRRVKKSFLGRGLLLTWLTVAVQVVGPAVVRAQDTADDNTEVETQPAKTRPRKGPRVGEITPEEQRMVVTRVQSLQFWSLFFGVGGASNQSNPNMFYDVSIGHHWDVTTHAEIRVIGTTSIPQSGNGNYTSFELGGSWFTSVEDLSPILGATIGYGLSTVNGGGGNSTTGGVSVGAHAGVRLFRTATAQLAIEGFVKELLISSPQPVIYGIQLGVLF